MTKTLPVILFQNETEIFKILFWFTKKLGNLKQLRSCNVRNNANPRIQYTVISGRNYKRKMYWYGAKNETVTRNVHKWSFECPVTLASMKGAFSALKFVLSEQWSCRSASQPIITRWGAASDVMLPPYTQGIGPAQRILSFTFEKINTMHN